MKIVWVLASILVFGPWAFARDKGSSGPTSNAILRELGSDFCTYTNKNNKYSDDEMKRIRFSQLPALPRFLSCAVED